MSLLPELCKCGKWKSINAKMCLACHIDYVKVTPVPVEYEVDPVRDAFDWIILQSRGEIS